MIWQLFFTFAQVGLFSFGGGYAAMPLIENLVVEQYAWLSASEFADLITIAGMAPGSIALNAATFVGMRLANLPGALMAVLGCVLPSILVVSLLFFVYKRYRSASAMDAVLACLRPAVVALIACAALTLLRLALFSEQAISWAALNWLGALLFVSSLWLLRRRRWNPILVMLACGAASLLVALLPTQLP